eukprot:IDg22036t1
MKTMALLVLLSQGMLPQFLGGLGLTHYMSDEIYSDSDFESDVELSTTHTDLNDEISIDEFRDNDPIDAPVDSEIEQDNDDDDLTTQQKDDIPAPRYPRRVRRAPTNWSMLTSGSPPDRKVTTGDEPTLREALNATPEERDIWISAIRDELGPELSPEEITRPMGRITWKHVKTAFLNADLTESVWVMSPQGIPGMKSRCYQLLKAMYGLKQAHLAWHTKLCSDLKTLAFKELASAPCVFRLSEPSLDSASSWWSAAHLHMSQSMYTNSVLHRFGMHNSKPAITPMVESFFYGLIAEENKSSVDVQLYQQSAPTHYCHRAVKRVLRYLRGSSKHALKYQTGGMTLQAYVDSDYAGDATDRKSMSRYLIKPEVVWLRRVMSEAGLSVDRSIPVRSDNQSAITWATGERCPSGRAKHIDVRIQFIRNLVKASAIDVVYVLSELNDSDFLTKPLG